MLSVRLFRIAHDKDPSMSSLSLLLTNLPFVDCCRLCIFDSIDATSTKEKDLLRRSGLQRRKGSASRRQRRLKGDKNDDGGTTTQYDTTVDGSCTSLKEYYGCGQDMVAICYVHDNHLHNKCVDVYSPDIWNKVPQGGDGNLYKDKYPIRNCGCCGDHEVRNNIFEEIKYPKGYNEDPYCDSITSSPSAGPTVGPTARPSSSPSSSSSPTLDPDCFYVDSWDDSTTSYDALMEFCNGFETEDDKCCQGVEACVFSSDRVAGKVSICKGSCNGINACDLNATVLSIGKYSCTGDYACSNVGFGSNSVSIGDNSCTESWACAATGAESESVAIGDNSCTGSLACAGVGLFSRRVTIGDKSCWDDNSCEFLGNGFTYVANGNPEREIVSVGDNSCRGYSSCSYLGINYAGSITVGEFNDDVAVTCDGPESCKYCIFSPCRSNKYCDCDAASIGQSLTLPVGTTECVGSEFCSA